MSADDRGYDLTLQTLQTSFYEGLPPPPPPPPLPPHSAVLPLIRPAASVEQPRELSEEKRAREFSEIEEQQDKLMATGEDLMGRRFQMQMDRKKICELRKETGAREGSVMNQLRTFLHKQDFVLPREIEETLEHIDALRDQLGVLEAEYDDSEQDYTMKEVDYNGKEMDFVDKLKSFHSRCPAMSTSVPTQTITGVIDRAPASPTGGLEIIKQQTKPPDQPVSEKALELVVQTEVHPDTKDVEDSQTRDIALFANKANVDDWLFNTLFQSPIQKVYLEDAEQSIELNQRSLLDAPPDWYWIGTFGAQFQGEELEGSHSPSQERNSMLSSGSTLPSDKPVLVLHTKGVRSS